MFALLAAQPRFNEIIKPFIALAPVASTRHVADSWAPFCFKELVISGVIATLGALPPGPIFPPFVQMITDSYCGHRLEKPINEVSRICNALSPMAHDMNGDRLTAIAGHAGHHLSRKNIMHSLQIHLANRLQKFDYGSAGNLSKYGSLKPPEYKLERITCPYVALIHAKQDMFVPEKDLNNIRKKFKG